MIGRLQRHAMDFVYEKPIDVFPPAASTGRNGMCRVIGAGPAGLSCAGELRKHGHSVTIFEKRNLCGGLSTYGIIALREPVPVALAEVGMIARMGVKIEENTEVGGDVNPAWLLERFDAVFLAVGLGGSPGLGIPGEEHIIDGLDYIEKSKLSPENLPAGREVVVIGAGNTAIDCATIARRTGSERVTMVYRRTEHEMTAYAHEFRFIRNEGVRFRVPHPQPVGVPREFRGHRGARMRARGAQRSRCVGTSGAAA